MRKEVTGINPSKLGVAIGEAIAACLVIAVFTGLAGTMSHQQALRIVHDLVSSTLAGRNLTTNYYGLSVVELWYTFRLLLAATIVAFGIGIGLPVIKSRVGSKVVSQALDWVTMVLESIPDPMYIIILVSMTVFLIDNYQIELPVFPAEAPSSADTIVPALALGFPGGLQLARVLLIRLQDESMAEYVRTARAKGATERRIFYRHIAANFLPTFIRQLPIVTGLILSSALFAEYFFEYQGALYRVFAIGFGHVNKPAGVPHYEPGYILVIGLLMLVVWLIVRIISEVWLGAKYPSHYEGNAVPKSMRIQYGPIILGCLLIGLVLLLSADPSLVDHNSPFTKHLDLQMGEQQPPYSPGTRYPMGTDSQGRDMLARTLQGTWATLWPMALTTLIVLVGSISVSVLAAGNRRGVLSWMIHRAGGVLSSMPVLFLLLLGMNLRVPEDTYQVACYIAWIAVFEIGRGSLVFIQTYDEWYAFRFVEGATALGRTPAAILFTHLRKWLGAFILEFTFSEFARVLSLMTMLAVFGVYLQEAWVMPMFPDPPHDHLVIASATNTWFSMIGDDIAEFAYISYGFYLYAPALALLFVTTGCSLIARGIQGKRRDVPRAARRLKEAKVYEQGRGHLVSDYH